MDPLALITGSTAAGSAITYIALRALGRFLSPSHRGHWKLAQGDLPIPEDIPSRIGINPVDTSLIEEWNHIEMPEWNGMKDIRLTRHFLSRAYSKKDLKALNLHIRTLTKKGRCGSRHPLNPRGDYDFDLVPMVTLLCLFGDEPRVLYPGTVEHLLKELLAPEHVSPGTHVPMSFGLFKETENHILMTEGSYHLVERWADIHGQAKRSGDRSILRRERFLTSYLEDIISKGLYEYNSDPYSSYAIHALLNLEAFGPERVASLSRSILDRITLCYHLGSFGNRRFPPFRRRTDRAGRVSLTCDGTIPYMRVWTEGQGSDQKYKGCGSRHALIGSIMPYRPPDWSSIHYPEDGRILTSMIGHGPGSSPEIYSRGVDHLITAGGVHRGLISRTVARPTTLMLDDGSTSLSEVLHLGTIKGCREHNNTGVFRNIAVSSAPAMVPAVWKGNRKGAWKVYRVAGKRVMVHDDESLSLFCVISDEDEEEERVCRMNNDPEEMINRFVWSRNRSVTYDIRSKMDLWVIRTVDGTPVERDLDLWPHLRTFRDTV